MQCKYFSAGECRSCQWLEKSYSRQLADKQQRLDLLTDRHISMNQSSAWLPAIASEQQGFRNKAKMVVNGSVERPILGIVLAQNQPVDLCDCPLYSKNLRDLLPTLKQFIIRAGLTPYKVERQRGELKFILLTENSSGEFMLRFVLRSETKIAQLRNALPWLLTTLPTLKVVSANIQPVHMAILEGEQEIFLTEEKMLKQCLNQIPLYMQPGSFFQTNTGVTNQLYLTAQRWVAELNIASLWDLFCGVGGFGLHCAMPDKRLTGIEINAEAIACAKRSAEEIGLLDIQFRALDSTKFAVAEGNIPDLVLLNPPRRGIGRELCHYLARMSPAYILYSSCNVVSMVEDLALLVDYSIERIQLFDMFPHTAHSEVLTLLVRR